VQGKQLLQPTISSTSLLFSEMAEVVGCKKEVGLFEVPDEILHNVFTFIANSPCQIGPSVCWKLRHLSTQWRENLDAERHDLWALATCDLSCDSYTHQTHDFAELKSKSTKFKSKKRSTSSAGSCSKRVKTGDENSTRRSTRLRASTPKESYIHAYNLTLSRTETAIMQLAEYTHSPKDSLTFAKLRNLVLVHGPVAINQRVRTGGTFLVEVCRARHVHEGVILKCVKLLINEYGANPNVPSAEFASAKAVVIQRPGNATSQTACSTSTIGTELYPLIIAAARGMPTVVKYLLESGADREVRGSCKFKLFSSKRSIKGDNLTALEFASKMLKEEKANGLGASDLKGLLKVVRLLDPTM
jgi:hypothetical protein